MITHFSMSQCFTHGKQKHRRLALKYLGVCKPKKSNEGDPQKDYINLPLQSDVLHLQVWFIWSTISISWVDSQTNRLRSISSPIFTGNSKSSSSQLGRNSDSSLLVSSELIPLDKLSCMQSLISLASGVSVTAFCVLYFVFPGLENCNLVFFPRLYGSSRHFAGKVNDFLLPTPFPCLDALFPLSLKLAFSSPQKTLYVSSSAAPCWICRVGCHVCENVVRMRSLTGSQAA